LHSKAGSGQRPQGGQGVHGFPPHLGHSSTSGHLGHTGGTISDLRIYKSLSSFGMLLAGVAIPSLVFIPINIPKTIVSPKPINA